MLVFRYDIFICIMQSEIIFSSALSSRIVFGLSFTASQTFCIKHVGTLHKRGIPAYAPGNRPAIMPGKGYTPEVLTPEQMTEEMFEWRHDEDGTPYMHCLACNKFVDQMHRGGQRHRKQLAWKKHEIAQNLAAPPPPPRFAFDYQDRGAPPPPPGLGPASSVALLAPPPPQPSSGTSVAIVAVPAIDVPMPSGIGLAACILTPAPREVRQARDLAASLINLDLPPDTKIEVLAFLMQSWGISPREISLGMRGPVHRSDS